MKCSFNFGDIAYMAIIFVTKWMGHLLLVAAIVSLPLAFLAGVAYATSGAEDAGLGLLVAFIAPEIAMALLGLSNLITKIAENMEEGEEWYAGIEE